MPKKERRLLPLVEGELEPPAEPEVEPAEEEVTAVDPVVIAPPTVRAGSLGIGQQFKHGGKLYRRTGMVESQVLGIRLVEEGNQAFLVPNDSVLLSEDALVIPK
jgi:hypothetical protein